MQLADAFIQSPIQTGLVF